VPRCQGEEFALEADQAARRDAVFEAHAPLAVRFHVEQFAAAAAEFFHDAALVVVLDIDGEQFVGFALLAVDVLEQHARARHREFVALATHGFEQDGQVQFAASRDEEHVGILGFLDAQGDVGQQLLFQAFADLAAGDVLAFLAGQRRGIDLEIHGQRRLIHHQRRQAVRRRRVANGDADADLLDAGDQHDVAGFRFARLFALEACEHHDLGDFRLALVFLAVHHGDFLAGLHAALLDAADADAADIAVVVDGADLQLQRLVDITSGCGVCLMMAS
jgi:hypothetical protein